MAETARTLHQEMEEAVLVEQYFYKEIRLIFPDLLKQSEGHRLMMAAAEEFA